MPKINFSGDQDFNNFYGEVYNAYFAEEVFYPNSTQADFVSEVISTAPLHWQLL
jgi:hypothetical protein